MSVTSIAGVVSLNSMRLRSNTGTSKRALTERAVSVSIIGIGVVVIAMGLLFAASRCFFLSLFLVHGRDLQEAVRSRGIDDCASQHQEAVDARAAIEAGINVSVHARPSFSSVCFGLVTSRRLDSSLCPVPSPAGARLPCRLSSCNESMSRKEEDEDDEASEREQREKYLPRKEMVVKSTPSSPPKHDRVNWRVIRLTIRGD